MSRPIDSDFPSRIDDALAAMREALGADNVFEAAAVAEKYIDPYHVMEHSDFAPGGAVTPGCVEDVQAVVRIANEFGVPISPISTGKNNAYGGAAPRLAGAIIVDLKRMNQIIEVDEDLAFALVEPGVSYMALDDHLRAGDSRLLVDTADLGWGSVVGNALEHGVGFTPYGDHFGHVCGMEVVLANGEVVRTGMGGVEGTNTWQSFKYGYGPYLDGLFTQSNFGIVTKMGIWLMPKPESFTVFMVAVPEEQDLPALVDTVRDLKQTGIIKNQCTVRHVLFDAATMFTKEDLYGQDGRLDVDAIQNVKAKLRLGHWNLFAGLYGSAEQNAKDLETVRNAVSHIEGAQIYLVEDRPGPDGAVLRSRHKVMSGQPNLNELKLLDWVPNGGHIDVAPILPMQGKDAWRQYTSMNERCKEYGHNYFSSFIFGTREIRHIATFIFDTEDAAERSNVLAMCRQLLADSRADGYGAYRSHLALMDEVGESYSWNDGAQMKLYEALKDAIDPNGILAPGKQGIWPAALRKVSVK